MNLWLINTFCTAYDCTHFLSRLLLISFTLECQMESSKHISKGMKSLPHAVIYSSLSIDNWDSKCNTHFQFTSTAFSIQYNSDFSVRRKGKKLIEQNISIHLPVVLSGYIYWKNVINNNILYAFHRDDNI